MLYRLHHGMSPSHAYMYTRHSFWCLFTDLDISIHIYSTRLLAFTWTFVGEFLTPLDLHVQILKLGLKWSPPPKIKLTSRSRLT